MSCLALQKEWCHQPHTLKSTLSESEDAIQLLIELL